MYRYSSVLGFSVVLLMLLVAPFALIHPARAQFIIASWDFPDEYGQGIYGFFLRSNSSGYWSPVSGPIILSSNSCVFDWPANIGIGFDARVLVNYTYIGLSEPEGEAEYNCSAELHPALDYLRLNVSLLYLGEIVFSQENFTYGTLGGKIGDGVWYYSERCDITAFLPSANSIYTAIITYEVYGPEDW